MSVGSCLTVPSVLDMLACDYVVMSTAFAIDLEDYERRHVAERIAAQVDAVRRRGDGALAGAVPGSDPVSLTREETNVCIRSLGTDALEDLRAVQGQQRRLAQAQRAALVDFESDWTGDSRVGVRHVPLRSVGLCVAEDGGSPAAVCAIQAAAIAARVAGVEHVVACVGSAPPPLVAALALAGVEELYRVSGPLGLAAMSIGTESIPRVDLTLGLGDPALAEAQAQLCNMRRDDAAGLLVIADESADAELVAADLVAAAECGPTARAVLITTSPALAATVATVAERQLRSLPRPALAARAWRRAQALHVVDDLQAACALANRHPLARVEVMAAEPRWFLPRLNRCSELFLGAHAGAPLNDGPLRLGALSGAGEWQPLSPGRFLRAITYQEARPGGGSHRTAALVRHRRAAGLEAQARACELRATRQLADAAHAGLTALGLA